MRRRPGCAAVLIIAVALAAGTPGTLPAQAQAGAKQLAQKKAAAARGRQKNAQQQQKKKAVKTAVRAKPAPAWRYSRERGVPTLAYGAGAEDEVLISFSCQPETGLVRVISLIGSRGVRPGDGAAIKLSNGRNRFEIAGTAFSKQANDAVDIGGATRIDPKLFALFRTGETLVVDVPGRKQSMPVASAKTIADAFQKACLTSAASKQAPAG